MDKIVLDGRRLVDIGYLFQQISMMSNHSPFACSFKDMYLIKEKQMGLKNVITFQCRMCNIEKSLSLVEEADSLLEINNALALATVSTGTGYSALDEIFSVLNIPFMSPTTYQKNHNKVTEIIESISWDMMVKAGQEEARLAIQLGQIDQDGIPLITVIADGAWSKRSYSVNYDASSGVVSFFSYTLEKLMSYRSNLNTYL
jgi:hypothetical protein